MAKKIEPRVHPAPFSADILTKIEEIVDLEAEYQGKKKLRLLDPFAGEGWIHELDHNTVGIELEPEWAIKHAGTQVGDACDLPFRANSFDVIATSPCMEHTQMMLMADLTWQQCGNVEVGDEVMAFDEFGIGVKANGVPNRRKWRKATVLRSDKHRKKCLRVVLEDGTEVVTTPEHPWLAEKYAYGGKQAQWVASKDLLGIAPYVLKQTEPWIEMTEDYKAGWLAGMYDGEGSLSLGVHGSPKLVMYQVEGPVMDQAEKWLADYGYATNRIVRKETIGTSKPVVNLYVSGGFPEIMRALGELRPIRLLDKWSNLDLSTRTIQPWKVKVVAVEDAGWQMIQEIETSTGTYIGEGYLHHNCYGNRMADHHNNKDICKRCHNKRKLRVDCKNCKGTGLSHRRTYKHYLGRELTENNAGGMQWGLEYQELHALAWTEAVRVLRPGGLFVLNIRNHYRTKRGEGPVLQRVAEWHLACLGKLGLAIHEYHYIETPGYRFGENRELRLDGEQIIELRKVA